MTGRAEIEPYVRALFDVEPNARTGWIPFHTARDVHMLITDEEAAWQLWGVHAIDCTEQDVIAVMAAMHAEGLFEAKLVTYGPTVEPRQQLTYSWAARVREVQQADAATVERWDAERSLFMTELQERIEEGEAILATLDQPADGQYTNGQPNPLKEETE